jgi:hypothetical protein
MDASFCRAMPSAIDAGTERSPEAIRKEPGTGRSIVLLANWQRLGPVLQVAVRGGAAAALCATRCGIDKLPMHRWATTWRSKAAMIRDADASCAVLCRSSIDELLARFRLVCSGMTPIRSHFFEQILGS